MLSDKETARAWRSGEVLNFRASVETTLHTLVPQADVLVGGDSRAAHRHTEAL